MLEEGFVKNLLLSVTLSVNKRQCIGNYRTAHSYCRAVNVASVTKVSFFTTQKKLSQLKHYD